MDKRPMLQKLNKFRRDYMPICVCEIVIMLITILGAGVLDLLGVIVYDHTIPLGVWLGAILSVLNYMFLTASVDKQINLYIELRGKREMSDEEAENFAKKHAAAVQNAIKTSFILRTVSIMAALLVAFITKLFNPIATVIPLLTFRFVLSVLEGIKRRSEPKPDPSKFIHYPNEDEDKNKEEESD